MSEETNVVRVAAVGDVHCTGVSRGTLAPLFSQMAKHADVLALCGDLTQSGTAAEAAVLAHEISTAAQKRPVVAVMGNHDVESGQEGEVRRILADAGIRVLDGESIEINGVGFAGVKGFGGGFHGRILVYWGEKVIKDFVQEALDEAAKLDAALGQLKVPQKIALMHYAPIRETVGNESPEIFPFLGSSHLETPLNKHHVTAAMHGHAHHGTPEGRTQTGVPVYNVSEWLMKETCPEKPYRLVKVTVTQQPEPSGGNGRAPGNEALTAAGRI